MFYTVSLSSVLMLYDSITLHIYYEIHVLVISVLAPIIAGMLGAEQNTPRNPGFSTALKRFLGATRVPGHPLWRVFNATETVIEIPSEGHAMMPRDQAPTEAELREFFDREPVLPEKPEDPDD